LRRKRIVGIYLAAGNSERFGKNKLCAQIGNYPLGSLALLTALKSQLDKIIVVTGETDECDWLSPSLSQSERKRWVEITCQDAFKGQSYSLQCGLRYAEKLHAEAVIVMLGDQPLISATMINQLIETYHHRKDGEDITFVASTQSDIICPPILFDSSIFTDLYRLGGDMGARYLIRNRKHEGCFIEFTNPLLFYDVDTWEDYKKLQCKINTPL